MSKRKLKSLSHRKLNSQSTRKLKLLSHQKLNSLTLKSMHIIKHFFLKKIDKKRKHYKTVSSFEIHSSQFTLFLQSFTKRFKFNLENFNQFNWNVSINQLFSINFIDKVKIIRHLYVKHLETKCSNTVHEIVQFIIDHLCESNKKITENYEYQFSFFKSVEFSFINSLFSSQIFNSSDFFDFFRLIARIFLKSSKLLCQKNLQFNSIWKTFSSSFSFSFLFFFESSSKSMIFRNISNEIEKWKTFLNERVCENLFKKRFQLKMKTMICVASRYKQLWTTICIMTSKI